MKLESTRRANRLLTDQIGTTIVSSSSSDEDEFINDDEEDRQSYGIEQQDFEFAAMYTYMTNVSVEYAKHFSYIQFALKITKIYDRLSPIVIENKNR